jgi:hypothetical protein
MHGDLGYRFLSKGAEDKAEDLLILDVPLFVCQIGDSHILAGTILVGDLFSRCGCRTSQMANEACSSDGGDDRCLPDGVIGLAELLDDGDVKERASIGVDDGGGRHCRVVEGI